MSVNIDSRFDRAIQEELIIKDRIAKVGANIFLVSKDFKRSFSVEEVKDEAIKKIAWYNEIIMLKHGEDKAIEFSAVYHSDDGFESSSVTAFPTTAPIEASGNPPLISDGTSSNHECKNIKMYNIIKRHPVAGKVIKLINTQDVTYVSLRKALELMCNSDSRLNEELKNDDRYKDFEAFINYEELSGDKGIHTHTLNRSIRFEFNEQEARKYFMSKFTTWYRRIEERERITP